MTLKSLVSSRTLKASFFLLALVQLANTTGIYVAAASSQGAPPKWAYDPGPDPSTSMGRELIDIVASIPFMPGISEEIMGSQKFRPAFGPIPWRMLQQPNSVKILFIGQDGTHIAEAAGRPATAGFGGRAQDLAAYFGVRESAAFMNAFAFTIQGQYGAFETPIVSTAKGKPQVQFGAFVDNRQWLMSQDPSSPIAQWRSRLIDWIIRNNRDSLRLIVLFGGAARDSAASFVEAHGGKVGTRYSPEQAAQLQIPETRLSYAGGNNQFPVPVTRNGSDVYAQLLGGRQDYTKPDNQEAAQKALKDGLDNALPRMVFTRGGPLQNGMIHPAQVGGYDLRKMEINGVNTLSIRGLSLSDGTRIESEVLLAQLPHPSALSRLSKEKASQSVGAALSAFKPYVKRGWEIEADPGMENHFAAGDPYVYSRTDIGPAYYDFGAPASRMVAVSDASRMPKQPHVIIFGTRDRVKFDTRAIEEMTQAQPATLPSADQMYIARPRTPSTRDVFDPGPGPKYARLMKENLPIEAVSAPKEGMSWEKNGIDAFNIKTHPSVRDFGHYRGTFNKPRVLIVADPDGADDLITARALTGTRGQYLHGLMEDLGIGEQYLVLKTVPFGMDGATDEEWNAVLEPTAKYRDALITSLLLEHTPEFILADGPHAAAEVHRILGSAAPCPVINVTRDGSDKAAGIGQAGLDVIQALGAGHLGHGRLRAVPKPRMADIPRKHLSFYARLWEGTSGDRVLGALDDNRGKAFAEVAPQWAWSQKAALSTEEEHGVRALLDKLQENRLPLPGQRLDDFLKCAKPLAPELFEASGSPKKAG